MATSPTVISPDDVQPDAPQQPAAGAISPDDVQPDAPQPSMAQPSGVISAPTQRPTTAEDLLTQVVGGGSPGEIATTAGKLAASGIGDVLSQKVGPEIPGTSKAWDIATGHRMPWEPPIGGGPSPLVKGMITGMGGQPPASAPAAPPPTPAAATPPTGDLVVKFGPTKDSWVGFGPNDPVGPNGETVQQLRQSGWKDSDISKHVQEKGIAPIASPVKGEEAPTATPALAPPPGFVEEPKSGDWGEWIGNLLGKISRSEAESVLNTIETAKEEAGGMVTPFLKASTPYIAWQMYKKATGQPNKLSEIPPNAIKALGPLLVGMIGGEGAAEAAPEAGAAETQQPARLGVQRGPAVRSPQYQPTPSGIPAGPSSLETPATQPTPASPTAEPEATGEPVKGKVPERFKPIQPGERTQGQKPIYQMTQDELEQAAEKDRLEERATEEELFGKEGAAKYRQSRGGDVAEEMESRLTQEQQERLFGIGHGGEPTWEDYRQFSRALGDLDTDNPEALGNSMRYAITKMGKIQDPAAMTMEQQQAFAQLRRGFEIAGEKGWNPNQVLQSALKGAAKRWQDPEDAAIMLRQFMKTGAEETPAIATPPPQLTGRTAVGTEGTSKGLRLEERGGKWYDTTTGEEYKWQVRRR